GRAPAHLVAREEDHPLRDAQHLGGGLPRRSRRRHVAAPRAHRENDRGRAAAAARSGRARNAGISAPRAPRARGAHAVKEGFRERLVPPVLILAVVLGAWESAIRALDVPPWLLPSPSAIALRFVKATNLLYHTGLTVLEALAGFAASAVIGITLSALIVHSRFLERGVFPYIIVSNAIPIIA